MNRLKFDFITKKSNLNTMKVVATYFLSLTILLYSLGCASIISKSLYPVNISSDPDGADITITDEDGDVVYTGVTPTTVTLKTKRGYFRGKDYTVAFKKDGYDSHSAVISRKADGWYIFGNLLFGGLIGYIIVDPATGAMWKLEPDLNETLTSKISSLNAEEQSIKIVRLKDVTEDQKGKMTQIN